MKDNKLFEFNEYQRKYDALVKDGVAILNAYRALLVENSIGVTDVSTTEFQYYVFGHKIKTYIRSESDFSRGELTSSVIFQTKEVVAAQLDFNFHGPSAPYNEHFMDIFNYLLNGVKHFPLIVESTTVENEIGIVYI